MLLVRRCGAAFSAVALVSAVLVSAALVVLPAERADAQQTSQPLVSNVAQEAAGDFSVAGDWAQAFTTGSARYILRSVDVAFGRIRPGSATSSVLTASIYTASGGLPGISLGTLTNPGSFPVSEDEQVLTFTSAGIALEGNTTYFLVLESGGNHSRPAQLASNGCAHGGGHVQLRLEHR